MKWASVVAVVCAASMITLITWPATDPITWQPLSLPAWWQFELLAGLGFLLSALPSLVIYEFNAFFVANENLRYPVAGLLVLLDVFLFCACAYKLGAVFDARSTKAQQIAAANHAKPRVG